MADFDAWIERYGPPIARTDRPGVVKVDGTTITVADDGTLTSHGGGSGGGLVVPSGQNGGLPYYNTANTLASSAALAANAIVLGGGASAAPITLGSFGTAGQVLTSAGSGAAPTWTTPASGSGSGTVTSVATGTGLTGGPITASGTISFANIASGNLLANVSGSAAAPAATSLSGVLDAVLGSSQGSIVYRGAGGWAALGPGTSGNVLQTQGASASPIWAAVGSGSGTVTLTGDISGSGTGTITTTLPTINSTVGTYPKVTINAKGQVTAGAALISTDLPSNPVLQGTGSVTVPVGTTGQQPGTPTNGMLRFNSTTSRYEWYIGAAWINHIRLTGETGAADLTGGSIQVPTKSTGTNTTDAASCAFVNASIAAIPSSTLYRSVSGTTDTPTLADDLGTVEFTSSSATTVTVNYLAAGKSYVVRRTGSGTVTLAAGAGVTLTSDQASPSYAVKNRYGTLTVFCTGTANTVSVNGAMT